MMNGVTIPACESKPKRQPLTVWELRKLLRPMHRYRTGKTAGCRERPHFKAILAFVHRNRFAVASQVQRRFLKYLPSDRTARRHLAEMESLGFLSVVETNNVSPLWPKVYFVTRRGLARLREALHDQGQEWSETVQDRRRSEGVSAQHVLHEVLTTEFLLMTWEATQRRDDLEILTMQRRSLAKHKSFKVVVGGRPTRLQPDGMFLYRQKGKGMMACFVEVDLDSMSLRQMAAKFRRYQVWAESTAGISFLKDLYRRYGATAPIATFRVLLVVSGRDHRVEHQRKTRLIELSRTLPRGIRDRIWITTVQALNSIKPTMLLTEPLWSRPHNTSTATEHRCCSLESVA